MLKSLIKFAAGAWVITVTNNKGNKRIRISGGDGNKQTCKKIADYVKRIHGIGDGDILLEEPLPEVEVKLEAPSEELLEEIDQAQKK